MQEPTGQIVKM